MDDFALDDVCRVLYMNIGVNMKPLPLGICEPFSGTLHILLCSDPSSIWSTAAFEFTFAPLLTDYIAANRFRASHPSLPHVTRNWR